MISPVVFGWTVVALAGLSVSVALFAMWLEGKRRQAEDHRLALLVDQARRRERFEAEFRAALQKEKSEASEAGLPTNPYRLNHE